MFDVRIDFACITNFSQFYYLLEQSEDSGENESSDAVQLREIFNQLESVKDDSQQRSWFLHEDEATICRNLDDLISILVDYFELLFFYDWLSWFEHCRLLFGPRAGC